MKKRWAKLSLIQVSFEIYATVMEVFHPSGFYTVSVEGADFDNSRHFKKQVIRRKLA